jgi:hypothetical protein
MNRLIECVYIDMYIDMGRNSNLYSLQTPYTNTNTYNNTHTRESLNLFLKAESPYTNMNINICARGVSDGEK